MHLRLKGKPFAEARTTDEGEVRTGILEILDDDDRVVYALVAAVEKPDGGKPALRLGEGNRFGVYSERVYDAELAPKLLELYARALVALRGERIEDAGTTIEIRVG